MIAKEFLDYVQRLTDAATPGPWSRCSWWGPGWENRAVSTLDDDGFRVLDICETAHGDGSVTHEQAQHNAAFIAMARETMPVLLKGLRKLTADLERTELYAQIVYRDMRRAKDELAKLRKQAACTRSPDNQCNIRKLGASVFGDRWAMYAVRQSLTERAPCPPTDATCHE